MFIITAPVQIKSYFDYTLCVVFEEWLGLEYRIEYQDCERINLSLLNDKKSMKLICSFLSELSEKKTFDFAENKVTNLNLISLQTDLSLLPKLADKKNLPIIFGNPSLKIDTDIVIDFDLFGTIFFMLSRFEEIVNQERDIHDRFPAKACLAYKHNFLDHPIVDEYVELLWVFLKKLWPKLKRKKWDAQIFVSCDVDTPFDSTVMSLPVLTRTCAGDLIKRKSIPEMVKRLRRYHYNSKGDFRFDLNYCFDWYMDKCEENNLKAAFYFIPLSIEPNNGNYSIYDKPVQDLLLKIDNRGHEIGVHGSYQTYKDGKKLKDQKYLFERVLLDLGINQKVTGNRQHFLRWDSTHTADLLDEAGFEYDTTGGYADCPGFRYGTCKEFSMWSWNKLKKLEIKQRPLVLMECSVIYDFYLGLGTTTTSFNYMLELKNECIKFDGSFNILWHNSNFKSRCEKKLFCSILSENTPFSLS